MRLRTIEQRIDQSRVSLRIDPTSNEKLLSVQKKVKDSFSKQSELHAKIIRGMRRKDQVEKQMQAAQDKETRYQTIFFIKYFVFFKSPVTYYEHGQWQIFNRLDLEQLI